MMYCPQCRSELSAGNVGGATRTVCAACGFVHWDNPIPVVAALVEFADKLVLARNAQWPRGVFSVITGFLEKNETPESGVVREAQEELGVAGEVRKFIGHYSLFRKNQLVLAYSVTTNEAPRVSEEIVEIELVLPQDLSKFRVIDPQEVEQVLTAENRGQHCILPLAVWCAARSKP